MPRFIKVVPVAGFEPARLLQRGILSPICLPFHHTGTLAAIIHDCHAKKGILHKTRRSELLHENYP